MDEVDIAQKWGKNIIEEVLMTFVKPEYGVSKGVIAYLRGRQRTD